MWPHERCEISGDLSSAWFMFLTRKSLALRRSERQVKGIQYHLIACEFQKG
jgi:hypothetical protein